MILDKCNDFCDMSGFKAIKLVFLPPNIISKLRPCDQGIICSIKLHNQKEMIKSVITLFEKAFSFEMNVLDALAILSAWNE